MGLSRQSNGKRARTIRHATTIITVTAFLCLALRIELPLLTQISSNLKWKNILESEIIESCIYNRSTTSTTIIYIELAWFNHHSETFYSFINYFCSCDKDKYNSWVLKNGSIPHFYLGIEGFVRADLRNILQEYNESSCGPIFFGTPPESSIDITLHTTSYAGNYYGNSESDYTDKLNDPRHIFICHENAPLLENASNVFFLTPLHNRYIVPSFFPPTIVQGSEKQIKQHPHKEPVFIVLGSFNDQGKRHVNSLKQALAAHREKNFTVHFLGGESNVQKNETLIKYLQDNFGDDHDKIKLTPNSGADTFMRHVGLADIVLPLVDETNFWGTYQSGKKLTSAISWGLGFNKKMIVYRPLAEVFGMQEKDGLYWLYENSTHFSAVFGQCLDDWSKEGLQ